MSDPMSLLLNADMGVLLSYATWLANTEKGCERLNC